MDRLSLATLGSVPAASRPPVRPEDVGIGVVHLGLGAFARAHPAVYTEAAMAATGDLRWGVRGVTQRSATVADQLGPQDGLYSVLTRSAGQVTATVNAAVREVLAGAGRRAEVVAALADPDVHVVTLTVTEKGYRHDPATGRLRSDDAELAADLGAGRAGEPVTVVGQLVRGLQRRMRAGGGGVTVVCCDNLPGNGELLRGLVTEFTDRLATAERAELHPWLAAHACFPATMVDRIVPATTPDDRAAAARVLGVTDAGVVVAEPFRQWVVQDSFAGPRPAWELAGATLTDDVAPYEAMKLRLLNGTHSALAHLGALAGYRTIAEAVADPVLAEFARGLMDADATPTLTVPAGFDLDRYKAQLLERFADPALRHRTAQVAMDGSQKLPQRLLGVLRERRAAGADPAFAVLAVAGWMRHVSAARTDAGDPLPVDDPLADRLRSAVGGATDPAAVADALLGVPEVFGTDLREDDGLRRSLQGALHDLTAGGARAAAAALARS